MEVSWLLAVDELALSLRNFEKPRNFMGKEFLLQSDKGLETGTAEKLAPLPEIIRFVLSS